jgi:hypothetical protein
MSMTEYEMAKAALRRPLDYSRRHPESQWNIDASLGILDWNGIDLEKARKCVEEGVGCGSFGMSIEQLREIVEGFDARFAEIKGARDADGSC